MKCLWNNFKVAFAMFSKIPMPKADWTEENMKYMFCFFPFIGAAIGGLTLAVAWAGIHFGYNGDFVKILLVLIPVLVTGGIHVDGLLDTSDALSSWQEQKRRLEILKDSHTGAFAVITSCVYFMAWYGAYSAIWENMDAVCEMAVGFMVSRCLSGMGVVILKKAREDGTVAEFSRKTQDKTVRNILFLYLAGLFVLMLWISPVLGTAAFLGAILIFVYYRHMALKYFGGTTGDLSGFFLCICEVGIALILAVLSRFV